MNLLFRFLITILVSMIKPRLDVLGESVLRLRVWPTDLDLNMHMNNGRYLSLMDLGRMDLLGRGRLLRAIAKRGWFPVVGMAHMRYRRSLGVFESYKLRSRILCWDEKWFYMEQTFERDGEAAAIGLIRGALRDKQGTIPPRDVLAVIGKGNAISPEMPPLVARWLGSEARA